MKTVKWGIIGCGDVTEVKSGPALMNSEHSEVVAVMRRSGELAKDYARRHHVPKWYDDAKALIDDPEVNAVYIATPPKFHEAYTLMAAKAGKHVYVEKPMARNYEECERMIKACDEAGVKLYVAYYRRALPRYLKVKELIEEGLIGDVQYVSIQYLDVITEEEYSESKPWRVIPDIAGGGKFLDLGSHTLDLFDYMMGPIEVTGGFAANTGQAYEAEDLVTLMGLIDGHIPLHGTWAFNSFRREDMNEIVGTKGKIQFSTFGSEPIRWITQDRIRSFDIVNPRHVQTHLIETIIDDLLGKAKAPSTGVTGARTNKVMDTVIKEYYR